MLRGIAFFLLALTNHSKQKLCSCRLRAFSISDYSAVTAISRAYTFRCMKTSSTASDGTSQGHVRVLRALLSVSEKKGLVELAETLSAHGVELLSTGGTAAVLKVAGLAVTDVSAYTGFPEILGGRVKTLHPRIHGSCLLCESGLLAVRGNPVHEAELKTHGIAPIDLVVVNLYPFEGTVRAGADLPTCLENIDIGGPCLIRAAAKNYPSVVVVTSPSQYPLLCDELREHKGATTLTLRQRFAAEAFQRTAQYDAAIAAYLSTQGRPEPAADVIEAGAE